MWQYLACNELPMQPLTALGRGYYPPSAEQLVMFARSCEAQFGKKPAWAFDGPMPGGTVTFPAEVRKFCEFLPTEGSNILFTDGERDPYNMATKSLGNEVIPESNDVTVIVIKS